MKLAALLALSMVMGCAESVTDDFNASDGGSPADARKDTGAATAPPDSATADTTTPPTDSGTTTDDTGTTSDDSGEFPDFGGGGADSGEFPDFGGGGGDSWSFPEGGGGFACTMDSECPSPSNCCHATKKQCGFKFGPTCETF